MIDIFGTGTETNKVLKVKVKEGGMEEYTVKIKALTPLWTGDAERKSNEIRETGIIGSLRWWYEALIRGLGGNACDPTNSKCEGRNHCDACELFGCTGWSRKFRLEVEKEENSEIALKFIELRKIKDIEWALLNKTIKIIANDGAIGGKITVRNYGLIEIKNNDLEKFSIEKKALKGYIKKKGSNINNPNLEKFVFIISNLTYETVKEMKKTLIFLKGRKGKGKRYFYKTLNGNPNRLFVYGENDEEYGQIVNFLKDKSVQFVEGKDILGDQNDK